jgi:hypothetical protein
MITIDGSLLPRFCASVDGSIRFDLMGGPNRFEISASVAPKEISFGSSGVDCMTIAAHPDKQTEMKSIEMR